MEGKAISNLNFDLFIAGGGINGAALARLAITQGLSTGLAEASDFGSGASSNTSKLVHGGLRYLESRDFGLVRDAVLERSHLLSLAPHLVKPTRFLFPICSLGRHGRWATKAGMFLYDALAGRSGMQHHDYVPAADLRKLEPDFLPQESSSAYAYGDCTMDDARLNLETILDAENKGAKIWNYHRITNLETSGNGWEVILEDRKTGREKILQARRIALTLGPWTDQFFKNVLSEKTSRVRLSQGSHLIMAGIPSKSCFILPVPKSKRYFFVIPFRGLHLVGTTETELNGDPGDAVWITENEKKELLSLIRRYFPHAHPRIVTTFSGIRPLATGGGNTITLSREHVFHQPRPGLFSVVGGKYTTHRVLARDFLCFILGKKKKEILLSEEPFPGSPGVGGMPAIRKRLESLNVGNSQAWDRWMNTYGRRAIDLAEYIAVKSDRQKPLSMEMGLYAGEVTFSQEYEHSQNPVDFFRRRTGLYFDQDAGLGVLDEVQKLMAPNQGQSHPFWGEEGDYRALLRRHGHQALSSREGNPL